MLIKIADRQLAPSTLILGRIGSAAVVLAVVAVWRLGARETLAQLRAAWRWLVVVGLVNTALPFWLLSWGEKRLDSGLASIIQGAVPIFNALLAFAVLPRAARARAASSSASRSASSASRCSSARSRTGSCSRRSPSSRWRSATRSGRSSRGGTSRARRRSSSRLRRVSSRRSRSRPAGVIQAPAETWHGETIMSILVLGVVGTAIAYLLFFQLIQQTPARTTRRS